jgi:type II secretory pathway component PulM
MRRWWQQLATRERLFVGCGALLAVAILLYASLAPLYSRIDASQLRLARKQADLRWIEASAPQIIAAGPGAGAVPGTRENALVLVDRAARESGLGNALSAIEPSGKDQLQARLSSVAFDSMVAWLARLRQQHAIGIAGLTVSPTAAPGVVNAQVQLQLAAP